MRYDPFGHDVTQAGGFEGRSYPGGLECLTILRQAEQGRRGESNQA
jgi:hypothetical protein